MRKQKTGSIKADLVHFGTRGLVPGIPLGSGPDATAKNTVFRDMGLEGRDVVRKAFYTLLDVSQESKIFCSAT
jgi:hypothetical protein